MRDSPATGSAPGDKDETGAVGTIAFTGASMGAANSVFSRQKAQGSTVQRLEEPVGRWSFDRQKKVKTTASALEQPYGHAVNRQHAKDQQSFYAVPSGRKRHVMPNLWQDGNSVTRALGDTSSYNTRY